MTAVQAFAQLMHIYFEAEDFVGWRGCAWGLHYHYLAHLEDVTKGRQNS